MTRLGAAISDVCIHSVDVQQVLDSVGLGADHLGVVYLRSWRVKIGKIYNAFNSYKIILDTVHQKKIYNFKTSKFTKSSHLSSCASLVYHWVTQQLYKGRAQLLPDNVCKLSLLHQGTRTAG